MTTSTPKIISSKEVPPDSVSGLLFAATAFLIWGFTPMYWKLLATVPAFEILMHRIIWSLLFFLPIIFRMGRAKDFIAAITSPKTILILSGSTVLVALNWFLFIYAINSDRITQTSLGYFITPLVNIFLGRVILGERLRPLQKLSVGIAFVSVFTLTVYYGQFPWIALSLAVSFSLYGLIRKMAPVGALVGLTVETFILSFAAVGYLIYLEHSGVGSFFHISRKMDLLLMGAALATGFPLLLFTMGARRIRYSTLGFLQYLAPSCTFLLGVLVYGEIITPSQLFTFIAIWISLFIFTVDGIQHNRTAVRKMEI